MKSLLVILIVTFLYSCSNNANDKDEKEFETIRIEAESSKNTLSYKKVNQKFVDSLMHAVCLTKALEFIDLYPVLDTITSDEYENLILVDSLKGRGFRIKNRGRGNWMKGPRIVSYTMSNKQCECQIDKLYYSTQHDNKYKVTERIKCYKTDK